MTGLSVSVYMYALMESALRGAMGEDPEDFIETSDEPAARLLPAVAGPPEEQLCVDFHGRNVLVSTHDVVVFVCSRTSSIW